MNCQKEHSFPVIHFLSPALFDTTYRTTAWCNLTR